MTFLQLQNLVYEAVADDSSSELYPEASVKAFLNAGESAFIAEKPNFSFLEADLLYTTLADTKLATDFDQSVDTTLTVNDSSTWPTASGTTYALWLEGDIMETWTGNAANVFSGIEGLQVDHSATPTPAVRPMYKLPSTVGKPSRIFVDGIQLDYIDDQHAENYGNRFTIYQDYIMIPENSGSEIIRIPYYKEAITLVADDDESLLPEEYQFALVYYALGKLLLATDEVAKSKSYCDYNIFTKTYSGQFGELLAQGKKKYAIKTARSKKRVELQRRLQSKT